MVDSDIIILIVCCWSRLPIYVCNVFRGEMIYPVEYGSALLNSKIYVTIDFMHVFYTLTKHYGL